MKSKYAHIEWLDLEGKGTLTEVAVMKRDDMGNVWFFPIAPLDNIDKSRLAKIVTNRNAGMYAMWDLMGQITLNNGINALTYFHQLVKILTPQGQILEPNQGKVGVAAGVAATGKMSPEDLAGMTMQQAQNI